MLTTDLEKLDFYDEKKWTLLNEQIYYELWIDLEI